MAMQFRRGGHPASYAAATRASGLAARRVGDSPTMGEVPACQLGAPERKRAAPRFATGQGLERKFPAPVMEMSHDRGRCSKSS